MVYGNRFGSDDNNNGKNILSNIKTAISNITSNPQKLKSLHITLSSNLVGELPYFVPNPRLNIKYTPIPPAPTFKLTNTIADTKSNNYKFIFNKNIVVNKDNIEFINSEGDNIPFTFNINNNELIINSSNNLQKGIYTINIKTIRSDDDEELKNLPLRFEIKSNFYVTGKDFGNYLSSETKELNINFNKNFTVNSISIAGVSLSNSIDNNKLKINLSLQDEKDYSLLIKVTSVDGEPLELLYNLTTKSITGNKDLDNILYIILRLFEEAKSSGLHIILLAIGVGVIFVSASWLWKLVKGWLQSI